MAGATDASELKAVTATLQSFKAARDWPDFIHSLQQLNGILGDASSGGRDVPAKHTVAKRLAQGCAAGCSPSVHTKVLELYGTIFARIGSDQLAHDLPLYSLGVLPLLANASPAVKPSVLQLLLQHYLPLGERLGPCLPGLIAVVTAELRDPTAAIAGQLTALLVGISEHIGLDTFCDEFCDCLRWSPHTRPGALHFLRDQGSMAEHWTRACALSIERGAAAIDALCECLGDAKVEVRSAAVQLIDERFSLKYCLEVVPDEGAHIGQLLPTPSGQVRQLTTAMLLLLRHDHDHVHTLVTAWLQDALPHTLDDMRIAPPACPRAAAAVVAALEGLLAQSPQPDDIAAWSFRAFHVLVSDSCNRQYLLPRLCPALVRRLSREHAHSPQAGMGASTQAWLAQRFPTQEVWAALAERWQAQELDSRSEATLLATALALAEAGVLTVEDSRTQQEHLPSLLAHVCAKLEPSDCVQSDKRSQVLEIGLRLVRIVLDRTDGWLQAAKDQITAAHWRCERFLLWFVRTHVSIDFTRLRGRQKCGLDLRVSSDCGEPWVLKLLEDTYQLTTMLHQQLTRMGCGDVHKNENEETPRIDGVDDSSLFSCSRGYEWITESATRAESTVVHAAIAIEALLPPVWLSVLHCIDANSTDIAWFAFKSIIVMCDGMQESQHSRPYIVDIMTPRSVFGVAVVRRGWDFLPSSVQVDVNNDDLRWEAHGDTAVVQWCRLQKLFPELCSAVMQAALTDVESCTVPEAADGCADMRMAHFRRYGLICAVAFLSSEDLLEMLHGGVLPMLSACADPDSQVRGCALMWLRWVIRTGLSWLLHILVVALANAVAGDDVRATYVLGLLRLIISQDEFFTVASVHVATPAAVVATQAAGMETSAGTWLRMLADITLNVARTSIMVVSAPDAKLGAAALACLSQLASLTLPQSRAHQTGAVDVQGARTRTDLRMRLIEPCLTLLTSSVLHSSTGLQMQMLSLVRALIRACAEPQGDMNESEHLVGILESSVSKDRLEASILTGLRHPHPVESPLLQQWLGLTIDVIGTLQQTRASTLRAVTEALVKLLAEEEGLYRSPLTRSGRAFVLVRSLADIVDQHLKGLIDLSAEALPADAFPDTRAADKSQVRDNGVAGLWSWRALMSSMAGDEEAEDMLVPQPHVQSAVVILQGLPPMVTSCVASWGLPEQASDLAPQRAEVARLFTTVWLARPFALFAGVLQWWLLNSGSESKPTRHRIALIEVLHKFGATAGEVITVGCKVLNQLYSATRAAKDGGSSSAVELKWSRLLALPLAEVQPGWTSLMTAFITHSPTPCSSEFAAQLQNSWPDLQESVHDSLHTALIAFHGPLPPALSLLRLLEAFIARAGSLSADALRKSVQDLTQRLVGQCLAVLPHAGSGVAHSNTQSHRESAVRASIEAAQLLGFQSGVIVSAFSAGASGSAAVANAVGLLTLQWLGHQLPSICNKVWAAEESTLASTLDGFVGPIMRQLNPDKSDQMPDLQLAAATFISAFAEHSATLAVWKPSVTTLLQRGDIFRCSPATLAALRPVVSAIFRADQARLVSLLARGQASGSALERASSFTFKRSADALLERESGLRRVTYVLWCGAVGQHRGALPNLVEALVESLEQYEDSNGAADSSSRLLVAVFLCMRAIALRVAPSDLAPFWSLASSEMLKVLLGEAQADPLVIAAAKKLLALFRILRPAAFLDFFGILAPRSTDIESVESTHHDQVLRQRQERLQRLHKSDPRGDGFEETAEFPPCLADGMPTTVAEAEHSIITDLTACKPLEPAAT